MCIYAVADAWHIRKTVRGVALEPVVSTAAAASAYVGVACFISIAPDVLFLRASDLRHGNAWPDFM